jgi:hypothetical protein
MEVIPILTSRKRGDKPHPVRNLRVLVGQRIRQKIAQNVVPVERWNRNQIEDPKDDIEGDRY